jgi:hypothetical protein
MSAITLFLSVALFSLVDNQQPSAGIEEKPAQTAAQLRTGRIKGRALPDAGRLGELRVLGIELHVGDSPHLFAKTQLDPNGAFEFENVPSGRVRLNPIFTVDAGQTHVSLPSALRLPATVHAEETTELTFFGKGQSVVGRVALPANIKAETVRVELQLIPPPVRTVLGRDGHPRPDPARHAYAILTARKLEANVDADGRFRIAGVREGNYRITAHAVTDGMRVALLLTDPDLRRFTLPPMPRGESEKPHILGTLTFGLATNNR